MIADMIESNNNSNESNSNENKQEEVSHISKWILRFEFDREKMFNKNIGIYKINYK